MSDNNIRKVYDALSAKYTNMAQPYEEFESMMTDEQNRRKVYDALSKKYTNMAQTWEEFNTMLTPAQQALEPAAEPVQPEVNGLKGKFNAMRQSFASRRQNAEQELAQRQADSARIEEQMPDTLSAAGKLKYGYEAMQEKPEIAAERQRKEKLKAEKQAAKDTAKQFIEAEKEKIDEAKEEYKKQRATKRRKFLQVGLDALRVYDPMSMTMLAGNTEQQIEEDIVRTQQRFDEYAKAKVASDKLDKALDYVKAVDKNRGVIGGTLETAKDLATWDFGYSGVLNNITFEELAARKAAGEELSASEEEILQAVAISQYLTDNVSEGVKTGYKVGENLSPMIGFVVSMALNPAAGLGKAFMKWAPRKFGKTFMGKALKRATGEAVEAAVGAATSGAGRTLENVTERHLGETTYNVTPEGYIEYAGQENQKDWGEAWAKGFGSQWIEFFTEGAGGPMQSIFKNITGGAAKKIGTESLRKIDDILNGTPKSVLQGWLRDFKKAAKWDGFVFETLEEELGMLMEPFITGDSTLGENFAVFSSDPEIAARARENQIVTIWTTAMASGAFAAAEVGSSRIGKKFNDDLNKADQEGAQVFTPEQWENIKDTMEEAETPEDLARQVKDMAYADGLSNDQRKAIMSYFAELVKVQHFNEGQLMRREEMTRMANNLMAAYDAGYRMATVGQPQQLRGVREDFIKSEEAIVAYDQTNLSINLLEIAHNLEKADMAEREAVLNGLSEEEAELVETYLGCAERFKGLYDGFNDASEAQKMTFLEVIKPAIVEQTDADGNQAQTITTATTADGRQVFVTGNDGKIAYILDEQTGKEAYPLDQLSNVQSETVEQVMEEYQASVQDQEWATREHNLQHNEKTQPITVGMVIGDGENTVIVTDMGEGWATIQQATTDKDGNTIPKPDGWSRDVTKDYLLAVQDDIYDQRDAMDGNPVPSSLGAGQQGGQRADAAARARTRIDEWANRIGVQVSIAESADQVQDQTARDYIASGGNPTGWYNPNTKQVEMYLPGLLQAQDVEKEVDATYLHEVIAHAGLRALLDPDVEGQTNNHENFNMLMERVWEDLMDDDQRSFFLKYNEDAGLTFGSEEAARRAAADEFCARMAEHMNANPTEEEQTLWQKFVQMVKDILDQIGLGQSLTYDEMEQILRASLANYEQNARSERQEAPAAEQQSTTPNLDQVKPITDKDGNVTDYEWASVPVDVALAAMREAGLDDDVIQEYASDMIKQLEAQSKSLSNPKQKGVLSPFQRQQNKIEMTKLGAQVKFWQDMIEALKEPEVEEAAEQEEIDAFGSDFEDVRKALDNVIDTMDFESMVRFYAARPKAYIWADDPTNGTKGFVSHVIATGGSKQADMLKNIGWLANKDKGGKYPEEVAHDIFANLPEAIKEGHDEMEVLDIVIETIQSASNPATVIRSMYEELIETPRRQEEEWIENQQHSFAVQNGFASYEDYLTFEELWTSGEDIVEIPAEQLEDYYNTLYGTDTDASTGTGVQGVVQPAAGQEEADGGSNTLGQTEGAPEREVGIRASGSEESTDNVLPGAEEQEVKAEAQQDKIQAAIDALEGSADEAREFIKGTGKSWRDKPLATLAEVRWMLDWLGYNGSLSKIMTDEDGKKFVKYQANGSVTPNIYLGETTPREVLKQFLLYGNVMNVSVPTDIQKEFEREQAAAKKTSDALWAEDREQVKNILTEAGIPFVDVIDSERGSRIIFTDRKNDNGNYLDYMDVSDADQAKRDIEFIRVEAEKYNPEGPTLFRAAPNGKKSNLTDEQWETVRTPKFKKWFGDWELAALLQRAQTAWNDDQSKKKFVFAPSERLAKAYKELLGHEIEQIVITDDAIRHIKKKHGEGEEKRGQVNITPEDIVTIPYILNNYDTIELTPERDIAGDRATTIKKRINGVTIVATIEGGKSKEFLVTNWKFVKSSALDAVETTPGPNVRNDYDITKIKSDIERIKSSAKNCSKIVDENGEPLVVYRGADFDPLAQEPGKGVIKPQAYFTADKEYASRYGSATRAYFLNIRHPFDVRNEEDMAVLREFIPEGHKISVGSTGALDWAELSSFDLDELIEKHPEYDGMIFDEGGEFVGDGDVSYRGVSYMPFKGGSQVKSATDNNGEFSKDNPDVRFRLYNPREDVPNVRGGWTKEKIRKYLKKHPTHSGLNFSTRLISEFDSPEELKDHMFYHGTVYGPYGLKPSITMSERDAERYGGGGYGDRYWGVSVSKDKRIASNFSGTSRGVRILPVVLAKGANVIERKDFSDASDLEDHIEELWNQDVDAVWIGDRNKEYSEQELCIINPRAASVLEHADYYNVYRLGLEDNPLRIADDAQIEKMWNAAREYVMRLQTRPRLKASLDWITMPAGEERDKAREEYYKAKEEFNNSPEMKAWEDYKRSVDNTIRFRVGGPERMEAADILDRYDNQDGTKEHPYMTNIELVDAVEESDILMKNDIISALISDYHVLDEEDRAQGRRDFAGGEIEDLIDGELIPALRGIAGSNSIRFRMANVDQDIFVSNAQRAVEKIQQEKATPQQWLAMIQKQGGIKAGEDKWLRLSQWLQEQTAKTLTKQEVLDYISENKIQIEEQRYGEIDSETALQNDIRERVGDGRSLEELQDEYDEILANADDAISELDGEIETFEGQMYEKYGERWDEKMDNTESYRYDDMTTRRNEWLNEPSDAAFREMVNRYGDDFQLGYFINGQGYLDYNIDPFEADENASAIEGTRPLNSTRLKYTTEGLDNKREIALTVPTIEPWNTGDMVHFGDAGEGRAVALVRFGDAKRAKPTEDEITKRISKMAKAEEWEKVDGSNFVVKKDLYYQPGTTNHYGASYIVDNGDGTFMVGGPMASRMPDNKYSSLEEAVNAFNKRVAEIRQSDEKILVIDEIQSKRHQEGREKGYKVEQSELDKLVEKAREEAWAFDDMLLKKYGKEDGYIRDFATDEEKATHSRLIGRLQELMVRRNRNPHAVPDAPFDKNWAELAMKRMLRLAAEEGYNQVAWTSGETQADRYDLATYIDKIESGPWESNGVRNYEYKTLTLDNSDFVIVNKDGIVTECALSNEIEGKPLSDVVGKELAIKLLTRQDVFEGDDLSIGGEGMKTFYDKILVNFMNKYGKQWGVQVHDEILPSLETGKWHMIDVTPEMKRDVLEGQTMFRTANGKNKQPGETEPEITDADDIRFRLSNRDRETISRWLEKRQDLTPEERQKMLDYFDTLEDKKLQLASGWWFAKSTVRFPEDMPKVEQAVKVASVAKVDPMQYSSPMELINTHANIEIKEKPINPDEVSTLHKHRELPDGIVVYNVDDSEESRQNMRRIIDTHFGKESSPWCLLQGDGKGNLTEQSREYWNYYNSYPKQVAFKDGKLLAFSANKGPVRWWDRMDSSHEGIPVEGKIPNDELGRSGVIEYDPVSGEAAVVGEMWRGNPENGPFETYYDTGQLKRRSTRKDTFDVGPVEAWHKNGQKSAEFTNNELGNVDGLFKTWHQNGQLHTIGTMQNGWDVGVHESYFDNGQLEMRSVYPDNRMGYLHPIEPRERFYPNGQMRTIEPWDKNGIKNGTEINWFEDGQKESEIEFVNAEPVRSIHWFQNGDLESKKYWDEDGNKTGVWEKYRWDWDKKKSVLQERITYKDGARNGLYEEYYPNGQIKLRSNYKDSLADGLSESWNEEGKIFLRFVNKDRQRIGHEYYDYDNGEVAQMYTTHDSPIARNFVRRLPMEGYTPLTEEEMSTYPDWVKEEMETNPTMFRTVTDPLLLDVLETGAKQKGYRTVAVNENGEFGSPMAGRLGKKGTQSKATSPFRLGAWEEAEENPDIATEDGKVNLIKPGKKGSVGGVDYNPYIHIRPTSVNKQFTQAWARPELVYIETEYPERELTSGYKADKAKLSVGRHPWNGGELILSRWDKPTRIVPWEEVADQWEQEFKESGVTFDIVAPQMLDILSDRGVEIRPPKKSAGKAAMEAYKRWKNGRGPEDGGTRFRITPETDAEYEQAYKDGDEKKAMQMVKDAFKAMYPDTKVVDEKGEPLVVYHAGTFGIKNGKTIPFRYMHFGTKQAALDRFRDRLNKWFYYIDGFNRRPDGKYIWDIDDFIYAVGEDSEEARLYEKLKSEQPGYDNAYEALMAGEDALGIIRPEYKNILDGLRQGEINESALKEMRYSLSPVYLNLANLKRVEDRGDDWNYFETDTDIDGWVYTNEYEDEGSDSYVVFNPNAIKSAEPFTFDDNGELIPLSERFNPENDDIRFRKADTQQESLFTPEEMSGKAPVVTSRRAEDIVPPLRKLEPGEVCLVQRKMTEDKNFNFTVGNKIESLDDIAYIFRELEDKSVENCFVVFFGGECKEAVVLHLSMGGLSYASVDIRNILPVLQAVKPSNVCMVHNHPSGQLIKSRQDDALLMALSQLINTFAPEVIVEPGIIIDTKSGKYGIFGPGAWKTTGDVPESVEGEHGLKVYNFDKSVFEPGFKPEGLGMIRNSRDVYDIAAFISGQRLGERGKINILCLNQASGAIGNFFSDLTGLEKLEDGKRLADEAVRYAGSCGATAVIVYGSGIPDRRKSYSPEADAAMRAYLQRMRIADIVPLEAVGIDEDYNSYYSYADHGVMEPENNYGDTRFRVYEDRQEGESARDFVKRLRQDYRQEFNEVGPMVILGEQKLMKPELKVRLGLPYDANINKVYGVYESLFDENGKIENALGWNLSTLGIDKTIIFARNKLTKARTAMTTMIHENIHGIVSKWTPDDRAKAAAAILKWADDKYGQALEDNDIRKLYGKLQSKPATDEDNELIAHIVGFDIEKGIDRERVAEYASKFEGTAALFDEILNKIHKTDGNIRRDGGDNQSSGSGRGETAGAGEINISENTLFRKGAPKREPKEYQRIENLLGVAAARYEKAMDDMNTRLTEVVQDSMRSVKEMQDAISEADGKPIRDFENAYWAAIQYSSRNKAMREAYHKKFYRPLLDEIAALVRGAKNPEAAMDELNAYLLAKHGLERNEVFARRDAKKDHEEWMNQHPNSSVTEDDFYNKYRRRDYSGLTALTMQKKVQDAEQMAQVIVDNYEKTHDTVNLWKRINAATKETLRTSMQGGVLSEEKYKELATMFEHYVPLRGFDQTTSDDIYGYYGTVNSPYNTAIKKAYGRRSLADSPIATIGNIADSEIMRANRNRIYMAALSLAENHHNGLLSVSELMFAFNPVTKEWEVSLPQLGAEDTPEEVAEKMQQHRTWFAQQLMTDPANYRFSSEMAHVPYKVINKNALGEHQMIATRGGKQYVMTVNGNPRAAQALNGKTNPDSSPALQRLTGINRFLASVFTQYNPSFVLANMTRDGIYTNSMVWVKESPKYAATYNKNWGKALANMASLLKKYKNDTLDDSVPMERYFKEFIDNGGETGYTQLRSVKDYKKIMSRELKDVTSLTPAAAGRKVMEALGDAVENMNRWAEGVSRFAAYMTSREQGRSVIRSVEDAKEISVNFNKKGSGNASLTDKDKEDKFLSAVATISQLGRELYVFFNAGVQCVTNAAGVVKNNPAKGTALMLGLFLGGAAIAMMNGGDGDDDDEKDYYNLPEYVRRNNICIKAGKHWITIPMPIELRAFYGLGELAYSALSGNEYYDPDELGYEVASQISQVLPIDFLEGGQGAAALIPSFAKPLLENKFNEDWTGAPIYNDSPFNENDPEWRKAFRSTSPVLVTASRKLNELSGGNVGRKGTIDINPARIEHLFEGYLGGVGSTLNQAYKTVKMVGDEDLREIRNVPVVNRFVKDADDRAAVRAENRRYSKVSEFVDEITNEDRRLRQMISERVITGYDYDDEAIKDAEQRLEELRSSKEWAFVQQWKAMDKARSAAKEGRDEEAFNDITRQMNEIYKKFRRDK